MPMEKEPGAVEKICPYSTLLIVYAIGCAFGIGWAYESLINAQMSLFERILDGVFLPLVSGIAICTAYFFVALCVHFIIKLYIKEKHLLILITAIVISIGLIMAFTIKG